MKRTVACLVITMAASCGSLLAEEPATKPAAAKLPFTISKETTSITKPLHEDGTPDYVAAMNEKYGKEVTPENNAFVAWLKILGTEPISPKIRERMLKTCGAKEEAGMTFQLYGQYLKEQGAGELAINEALDEEYDITSRLWTPEDFPLLAQYLEKKGEYLDAAKEAFGRKRFWMPYVSSDGRTVVNVLLPSLSRMKDAANGLAGRATLRDKAGDFGGFLSDVVAMKKMSRHMGSDPFLITRLVAGAIDDRADRAIGAAAGSGIFSEAQCVNLWKELQDFGPLPPTADSIDVGERWNLLDMVIIAATGKIELVKQILGDNRFREIDQVQVDWDVVLKRVNTEVDDLVAASKKETLEEMNDAWKAIRQKRTMNTDDDYSKAPDETREAYTARVETFILNVLLPDLAKAEELRRRYVLHDQMVNTLVAAAGYKAAKGKWPAKLSDLVPAYIKEVPKDIYSEGGKAEVTLETTANGAVVKSVGWKMGSSVKPFEVGAK